MHLFLMFFMATVHFLVALARGAFFVASVAFKGAFLAAEMAVAHARLRDGLRCPRGHDVVTDGEEQTIRCGACGYTYTGSGRSMWLCPNAECGQPTPYINCATCGLSVSSPYRFLHS